MYEKLPNKLVRTSRWDFALPGRCKTALPATLCRAEPKGSEMGKRFFATR
jgi:hypothetical protein